MSSPGGRESTSRELAAGERALYCPACNEAFEPVDHRGTCPRCGMAATSEATDAPTLLWRSVGDWDNPEQASPSLPESYAAPRRLIGQRIDRYDCEALIGRGGMGWVFLARHRQLGRACALKVLTPDLAERDPEFLERFEVEGQAAAAIVHPNIVTIHAIGEAEGLHFLEMEFVPGRSLQAALRDGPLPLIRAMALTLGIANGMSMAHRHGIVHRDLKPDNVLLTHDGMPKIADFGLAKRIQAKSPSGFEEVLAGTPHFMAPELFAGQQPTPASDVYALGVCLYAMLTGELPYLRGTLNELMHAVTHEPIPNVRTIRPEVPLEISECLALLMEKCPANRPANGIEAAQLVSAILGQTRDLETLLHEAFTGEPYVRWSRAGDHYEVWVYLPDGRSQCVRLESTPRGLNDRLLQIYSICCPADAGYYAEALQINSRISHGAIALRRVEGADYFVVSNAYPRSTVDPEEIRRSVLEVALHADTVEQKLTGEDHNWHP